MKHIVTRQCIGHECVEIRAAFPRNDGAHPCRGTPLLATRIPQTNRIYWIMHRRALKYKWVSELPHATLGPGVCPFFPFAFRNIARILLC